MIGPARIALFLTWTVAAQNRGPLDLANAAVPQAADRIAYGSDPLQFGELRLPRSKAPHPVAIVVHGGCWLAQLGSMDKRAVAMDNMRPLAAALTDAGVATWNIEYRRLGDAGGGWPGTFLDVAHAADFLRTVAREHSLDLTRVVSIGHSAGGHLENPLPMVGVVNLDGPPDLKATLPLERPICGAPVVTDLIGGSPAERAGRYHEASPVELLPLGVRQVLFAGQMFAALAAPYEAAAKAAGDRVQTTVLPQAGHFVFIDPQSDIWPEVLERTRQLLSRTQ